MNKDRKPQLNDEVSAIVYQSLTPPQMFNMGAGSEMDHMQRAKWRSEIERRWQYTYTMAEGVSPEAVRILQVVGAEFGFERRGRKLSLDSGSSALLSILG
jgi:hypothetical protein